MTTCPKCGRPTKLVTVIGNRRCCTALPTQCRWSGISATKNGATPSVAGPPEPDSHGVAMMTRDVGRTPMGGNSAYPADVHSHEDRIRRHGKRTEPERPQLGQESVRVQYAAEYVGPEPEKRAELNGWSVLCAHPALALRILQAPAIGGESNA